MPYRPHTDADRDQMFSEIGVSSMEDLFELVPKELRLGRPLDLPPGLSEHDLARAMGDWAAMNVPASHTLNFLGAGIYGHFIPALVPALVSRGEFLTSYTPYQPEVSQGTLQSLYEFQSIVCRLTGMEVANASMYDGASALAEGALMAMAMHDDRSKILLAETIHPAARAVVDTYAEGLEFEHVTIPSREGRIDLDAYRELLDGEVGAVVLQHPNFFGCLEEAETVTKLAQEAGATVVMNVDPISLGLLKPPGSYGADIVTAEGQGLGLPMNYGGPLLGIFACKQAYIRKMPGRLIGKTVDLEGRPGYCMTLQTREQHIRREKATSNICTSEALLAIAMTAHVAALGPGGVRQTAELCVQKAHYAAERIAALPGFRLPFTAPFFKEFVVDTPVSSADIVSELADEGILCGVDMGRFIRELDHHLLICVTERRSKEDIDRLVEALSRYS
ncbi:MAG: aminomethyl-transferring glycine dehydrogenase subunit GcvPA [Armatimonadetes bacterium]|nr:aminomethyl-transferring glycine dehydrogenase subunit GcvPA [Armatimonadota bacterium]